MRSGDFTPFVILTIFINCYKYFPPCYWSDFVASTWRFCSSFIVGFFRHYIAPILRLCPDSELGLFAFVFLRKLLFLSFSFIMPPKRPRTRKRTQTSPDKDPSSRRSRLVSTSYSTLASQAMSSTQPVPSAVSTGDTSSIDAGQNCPTDLIPSLVVAMTEEVTRRFAATVPAIYTKAWNLFTDFHTTLFQTASFILPIMPATLALFIAYLFERNYASSIGFIRISQLLVTRTNCRDCLTEREYSISFKC